MVDFAQLLAGFGLAGAAGLNAWLPLLMVGLAARYTQLIHLNEPYTVLQHPATLIVLGVLLVVEIVADKIPAIDTVNDLLHTVIRPAAGAILFAANANAVSGMDPVLMGVLGLLAAGGVHAAKSTARPFVTASTAGTGNAFVSAGEDILSGLLTFLALVVPVVAVLLLAALLFGLWRFVHGFRRCPPA